MIAVNEKIIVKVNRYQKNAAIIGDNLLMMGKLYATNHREKAPVIAYVVDENRGLNGEYIICHHNILADDYSPYFLGEDLYAIPYNHNTVFAHIDKDGNPQSVCGNIITERISIESVLPMPPEYQKNYKDRVRVLSSADGYKQGDIVFTIPFSDYEICFTWNNVEKRIIKIHKDDIVAIFS